MRRRPTSVVAAGTMPQGPRIFDAAFQADPKWDDARVRQRPYDAARLTPPAGCDRGGDDKPPDEAEMARPLGWLDAELSVRSRMAGGGTPADRAAVADTVIYWRSDPDLGGLRGEAAIRAMPEGEQRAGGAVGRGRSPPEAVRRADPLERPDDADGLRPRRWINHGYRPVRRRGSRAIWVPRPLGSRFLGCRRSSSWPPSRPLRNRASPGIVFLGSIVSGLAPRRRTGCGPPRYPPLSTPIVTTETVRNSELRSEAVGRSMQGPAA
jgi:hypothetical protein